MLGSKWLSPVPKPVTRGGGGGGGGPPPTCHWLWEGSHWGHNIDDFRPSWLLRGLGPPPEIDDFRGLGGPNNHSRRWLANGLTNLCPGWFLNMFDIGFLLLVFENRTPTAEGHLSTNYGLGVSRPATTPTITRQFRVHFVSSPGGGGIL
jgi:hypothetical protein